MELQEKSYSCGPAALRAVLYVYGKKATEKMIRRWARTTPEGTDEEGLKNAIAHYKFRHVEHNYSGAREATDWLKKSLRKGVPAVLCVDKESHWVAAVGMLGKKIIVFDPEPSWTGYRPKYSGLKLYLPTDLAHRWVSAEGTYYSLAVLPPKD